MQKMNYDVDQIMKIPRDQVEDPPDPLKCGDF